MLLLSHLSFAGSTQTVEAVKVANIYLASMDYIFSQQGAINSRQTDKSQLFGNTFIHNVAEQYKQKFGEPFPEPDSKNIKLLYQTMVEVMEDNRTLLLDSDISFKGFIPAVYAFQLSQKFVQKGVGIKLKFTNKMERVRNKFNAPLAWEQSAIESIDSSSRRSVLDMETEGISRYMVRVDMVPMCLNCHGSPQNNPKNKGKSRAEWTDKDVTGYKMENWTIEELGGAVSVIIEN